MTFGRPGDITFNGSLPGATDAANAIVGAPNGDPAVTTVSDTYNGTDASWFYVTYNANPPQNQSDAAVGTYIQNGWNFNGYTHSDPSFMADAVFAAAAPEPGSVALAFLGLAGVATRAWRLQI